MGERRLDIRGRDLNAHRHVNSAVYATYLEECRNELLRQMLAGVGDVDNLALAHLAIDYRRDLTTEDGQVVVSCVVERVGTSSITFREEIRTAAGELAAESKAVVVVLDAETGRSRPITEPERVALLA